MADQPEKKKAPAAPLWRRVVDGVDAQVGPRLNDLTHSSEFHDTLGVAGKVVGRTRRIAERSSRRVLHLFNLPAGSDMLRLNRQIAALDHEVRRLRAELAIEREKNDDGPSTGTRRRGPNRG